jgi:hypothetical protein
LQALDEKGGAIYNKKWYIIQQNLPIIY